MSNLVTRLTLLLLFQTVNKLKNLFLLIYNDRFTVKEKML